MKSFIYILLLFTITLQAQNGIIRSYYANHKIQARLSYVNDVLDAKSIWYFDNGNIKTIKTYNLGKLNGNVTEFYKSGLVEEKYYVNQGIRDGFDRIYWKNGALKELRYYKLGRLVKRTKFDYDPLFVPQISDFKGIRSDKKNYKKEEIPICDVDICPEPIGGMKAIQEKVIYPKEAKQYGLEGRVSIVASIDTNGIVTNAEIIKGIGLGCDKAALDAVKKSRFLPGLNNGKITKSHLTINIDFKIPKNEVAENTSKKHPGNDFKQSIEKQKLPVVNIEDSTDVLITSLERPVIKSIQAEKKENPPAKITKTYKNLDNKTFQSKAKKLTEAKITCNLEICPEPIGGIGALLKKFKIPHIAYKLRLNGTIVIQAKIDKWGNVLNTKVISGVGHGVGTAAEVAVLFTKFKPGEKNAKPVTAIINISLPLKTSLIK